MKVSADALATSSLFDTGIASRTNVCRRHRDIACPAIIVYISGNDKGTEELGHLEMVGAIVHQLTRGMKEEDVKAAGLESYFVDHTAGVYPQFASGTPWTAATMQVKGDVICDLTEDLAAEQKARVVYDNILRLSDDPDVNNVIRFLREREIVHYQRFGEGLRLATERLNQKNIYAINPSFDK
jgi:spore coat protein JC